MWLRLYVMARQLKAVTDIVEPDAPYKEIIKQMALCLANGTMAECRLKIQDSLEDNE